MKKSKFKKNFVKQNLLRLATLENLKVYESIKNQKDVMGDKNYSETLKKFGKVENASLKEVGNSYKLFQKYDYKLDKLTEFQRIRRMKLMDWCAKYEDKMEKVELNRFMGLYEDYINLPTLDKLVEEGYNDETLFFGERITPKEGENSLISGEQDQAEEVIEEETLEEENEEEELEDEDEEIEEDDPDTDLLAGEVEDEPEEIEQDEQTKIEALLNS